MSSNLKKLRERQAQLTAQIRSLEARERQQQRKNDTRRKVIVGAFTLHHMEKNPESAVTKTLMRLLDEYVTRPNERLLLGLPPVADSPANDQGQSDEKSGLKSEFHADGR
jgi:hypothetical protein